MAGFSVGWLISASRRVNWDRSTEFEDPRWPYSYVWDLVLAVGRVSSVSFTWLFSPMWFPIPQRLSSHMASSPAGIKGSLCDD